MEYAGYVVVAVIALAVGWLVRRPRPNSRTTDVSVILQNDRGQWAKKMYGDHVEIHAKDTIRWVFGTPADVKVRVFDFRDLKTQKPKNPLTGIPSGTAHHSKKDVLTGKCRGNEIFDEQPPGDSDELGRYQDFTYKLEVDGVAIDPEIRIREC